MALCHVPSQGLDDFWSLCSIDEERCIGGKFADPLPFAMILMEFVSVHAIQVHLPFARPSILPFFRINVRDRAARVGAINAMIAPVISVNTCDARVGGACGRVD